MRWLVAVQSQDYPGAKWALGQRTRNIKDADLDRLYDEGAILRTHVMRPTWHFVLPDDIRWLLSLTAPRVKAIQAHYDWALEIDQKLLRRTHTVLEKALRDNSYKTRSELADALERAGIPARGQRLGHLVAYAELDALIVSGPLRGKQFTYALLDERAPSTRRLARDEALAELTLRYFTGHGPAQVNDFAWWSGLTVADAKRGLALTGQALAHEVIGGKSHWSSPDAPRANLRTPIVHLLPNYDEFLIAYRDRAASLDPAREFDTAPFPYGSILAHVVVLNGQVWGGWKRRAQGKEVAIELGPLDVLNTEETAALHKAADDIARFLGAPVRVSRGDIRPGLT
ncbi:MAG: winged helix DNA-binding domain-containing protein [Candidatus Dormibacteraeota bacterium]|nr:winged helix DNA-binding domain-containing protein [Candidatus Dormibacteraeota bacterium]